MKWNLKDIAEERESLLNKIIELSVSFENIERKNSAGLNKARICVWTKIKIEEPQLFRFPVEDRRLRNTVK